MSTDPPGGSLVLFHNEASICRITINRPDKRNALSLATVAEIADCLRRAEEDATVRVVILTGTGEKAFAAGADIDELPGAFTDATSARAYDDRVTALYEAMETSRLPIVARMSGAAIGGGCLLALACDIRVASTTVKVGFPLAKIGLMLSPKEYQMILDQMPPSRAKRLLFSSQILTAKAAAFYGLIDEVVEPEQLDASVDELATSIAAGAPLAIAASKRISNALTRREGVEEAVSAGYRSVYPSDDLAEGLAAIKEKRFPKFKGS